MKRLVILLISLIAVGGLTWYAWHLSSNKGKSDTELIEFAIKDVNTVDRFIITDPFGRAYEVIKQADGTWTNKAGECIAQSNVEFILDAFKKIEFKGYLPDKSIAQYQKLMTAQHTKVEIFQNGEWSKTWYLGPTSQDHYGQIMLLDDAVYGKSDVPVMMKIRGLNGIIEPRFFADPKKWLCTNIFAVPIAKIQKVSVEFNEEAVRSFSVARRGTSFDVYQQGRLLQGVDTTMIFRYLNNYQKIHFELANYELNDRQVDSLKSTRPFCVLTVKETDGKTTKLRCFRIKQKTVSPQGVAEFRNNDHDRFWCQLPNGEVVKCQYFVFNPLFLGHIFFPMDISSVTTADGIPD
jgi:hypothetical protein